MEIRKINDEIKAKNQLIASLEKQMADSISANQNKMDKLGLSPVIFLTWYMLLILMKYK